MSRQAWDGRRYGSNADASWWDAVRSWYGSNADAISSDAVRVQGATEHAGLDSSTRLAADGRHYTYDGFVSWYGARADAMWTHASAADATERCPTVDATERARHNPARVTEVALEPGATEHVCPSDTTDLGPNAGLNAIEPQIAAMHHLAETAAEHCPTVDAMEPARQIRIRVIEVKSEPGAFEHGYSSDAIEHAPAVGSSELVPQMTAVGLHDESLYHPMAAATDHCPTVEPAHGATEHGLAELLPPMPPGVSQADIEARPSRPGHGGKWACAKQRELRAWCLQQRPVVYDVDLTDIWPWQDLLKSMFGSMVSTLFEGHRATGFSFRLLKHQMDTN